MYKFIICFFVYLMSPVFCYASSEWVEPESPRGNHRIVCINGYTFVESESKVDVHVTSISYNAMRESKNYNTIYSLVQFFVLDNKGNSIPLMCNK